jgi:hypothetical protein
MIFVDTSAWVALCDESEHSHVEASDFWESLRRGRVPLVSTFDIFDETLTVIRSRIGSPEALRFGEAFLGSRVLLRLEVDSALRQEAWGLFKQYQDKPLSFTDCTSFAVLRRRGLRHVFSFDEDFRRLGFLVNILP